MVCEAYQIAPSVAEQQDDLLVQGMLLARAARAAVLAFNTKGATMSDEQGALMNRLLDSLDDIDTEQGIPEEA